MIPITELRQRVGLQPADATQDAVINATSRAAMSLMEKYCRRKFGRMDNYQEDFTHVHGNSISLELYPVRQVHSVTHYNGPSADAHYKSYHVDADAGLILFDGHVHSHRLTVEYDGGFDASTLPGDMRMALLLIFDNLHDQLAGGAATVQSGEISRVVLQGVGSVQFSTAADAAKAASSGSGGSLGGLIPLGAMAILDLYRRALA